MGCGCGRASSGTVAPVVVEESSGYISESQEPNVAKFEKIYTHSQAPVAETSNMLVALSNLAGKEKTSGLGIKLRGIPILSRKKSADTDTREETVDLAHQTSVPVAYQTRKYSILDVIKDTLTGNAKYSEEDIVQKRLQVCNTCPNQIAGACSKCGCIIKLKVKYEESSCPINKW